MWRWKTYSKESNNIRYIVTLHDSKEEREKRSLWSEGQRMVVHLRQLLISKFFSLSLWCSGIRGSPTICWMSHVWRARLPLSVSPAVRGCVCVAVFYSLLPGERARLFELSKDWLVGWWTAIMGAGVKFHYKSLQSEILHHDFFGAGQNFLKASVWNWKPVP